MRWRNADDSRARQWLDDARWDVAYALRLFRQNPGFTAIAVIMLGVGIGVNAAVFSITNAVLFKGFPLVIRNDRIAYLDTRRNGQGCCVSYPDFTEWRAQTSSFEGLAAIADRQVSLSDAGRDTEHADATLISANGFGLLGVKPILGRDFLSGDEQPGAAPVAILRYNLWQRRYSSDPTVVGRTILLDGAPTTVIGVMPRRFSFPQMHGSSLSELVELRCGARFEGHGASMAGVPASHVPPKPPMLKTAKRRVLEKAFSRFYAWRLEQFTDDRVITLDYPVRPAPRYTPEHRAHPELWTWFDRQRAACADALDAVSRCREALERIPRARADQNTPYWDNIFFSALDAMALYSIIATRRPSHIVEVGSGNSTKFARQAIRDAGCDATLVSIDPQPRAEIDALCSRVLRQPLEQVDQSVFAELSRGDILFIDSSHRAFTNSDVTTFFLEILPRLASGVIVHVHDIFLPWDYPVEWNARYYSEQYLMASWLLAGPERCRLLLSNAFTSYDSQLRRTFANILLGSPLAFMADPDFQYGGIRGLAGVSLWVEVV